MSMDIALGAEKSHPKNGVEGRVGRRRGGHLRLVYSSDWAVASDGERGRSWHTDPESAAIGRNWTIVLIVLSALAGPALVSALLWTL